MQDTVLRNPELNPIMDEQTQQQQQTEELPAIPAAGIPVSQDKKALKARRGGQKKRDLNSPGKTIPAGIGEWYEFLMDSGRLVTRARTQQVHSQVTGQVVTVDVPGGVDPVVLQPGEVPWPSVRFNGRNFHAARVVWFLVNGKDPERLAGPNDGNPMNVAPDNWYLRRGVRGRPPGSVATVRTKELYEIVVELAGRVAVLERSLRVADAAAAKATASQG